MPEPVGDVYGEVGSLRYGGGNRSQEGMDVRLRVAGRNVNRFDNAPTA